jgi:hypothetical protein
MASVVSGFQSVHRALQNSALVFRPMFNRISGKSARRCMRAMRRNRQMERRDLCRQNNKTGIHHATERDAIFWVCRELPPQGLPRLALWRHLSQRQPAPWEPNGGRMEAVAVMAAAPTAC